MFAEINAPGAYFLETRKISQTHRFYVLPPLKNHPSRAIGFVYSPLWKITHQSPWVLCTPPFEKSPIKSHRFYVLPPLKNHFLVGAYFGVGVYSGKYGRRSFWNIRPSILFVFLSIKQSALFNNVYQSVHGTPGCSCCISIIVGSPCATALVVILVVIVRCGAGWILDRGGTRLGGLHHVIDAHGGMVWRRWCDGRREVFVEVRWELCWLWRGRCRFGVPFFVVCWILRGSIWNFKNSNKQRN